MCAKAIGGRSLWAVGYPKQATRSTDASIVLAETLGHAPSLTHALLFASLYRQSCRDAVAVLTITERLIALAVEHRLALYHAVGCIARGWALAQKGQLSDGLGSLRRDVEAMTPVARRIFRRTAELR